MNLVDRAKNIVLAPKAEWPVIAAEPATIQTLYAGYALPLALIPAVAGFIGLSIVGISLPVIGTMRVGFFHGLVSAVLQLGLGLAALYVVALVIDGLAPTFGGRKDLVAAFKVATYAYTPAWLAGIFSLVPALAFLSIVGLYSFYLLYLGLPRLMGTPQDKALPYTAAVIAVGVVLSLVIGAVLGILGPRGMM